MQNDTAKVIALSSLGGLIEFYDFTIYLFFADLLRKLFFPSEHPFISLLGILVVFALGYLVRPLGGIIFSHYGDRYGRKKVFAFTIMAMAVSTFLIGVLPTYAQAGVVGSVFIVILRLCQGLSLGGEIPGALTFAGEYVPAKMRGLTCAIILFAINLGMIVGSLLSLFLSTALSQAQLVSWGWRIPFYLGGTLGVVSYYLREKLSETPIYVAFEKRVEKQRAPIIDVFHLYWRNVLQGFCLISLGAALVALYYIYMQTYLKSLLHYQESMVEILNTLNILLFSILLVVVGFLSDKVGRRKIFLTGSCLLFLFSYGFFWLLQLGSIGYVILAMVLFSFCCACITGIFPSALIELFPTPVRYTGSALCYNVGFALFGGLSPLLAAVLIQVTHLKASPSFILMLAALLGFIGMWFIKDKSRASLHA